MQRQRWHRGGAVTLGMAVRYGSSFPLKLLRYLRYPILLSLSGVLAQTPVLDDFNPGADDAVYALAVQEDGKILVGGRFTKLGGQPRAGIGRLLPDGTLDSSFNPGVSSIASYIESYVRCVAVQGDGRVLVGGNFYRIGGQQRWNIGRLHPDGTPDRTFDPGADSGVVSSLVVQVDGKILVGGSFTSLGGRPRASIGRLNPDGTLDQSFDPGATGSLDTFVATMAVQEDGMILVGGAFWRLAGTQRSNIGRLNPDGTVEGGFNPGTDFAVFGLARQADGMILVGGDFRNLGGQPRAGIGRLYPDGTVDHSFDPGTSNPQGFGSRVHCLAVQADGKILVGGSFTTLAVQTRSCIGRLHPDGALDASFNPGASSLVYCLVPQTDGKILVGGAFTNLAGGRRDHVGRLNNPCLSPVIKSPFRSGTILAGDALRFQGAWLVPPSDGLSHLRWQFGDGRESLLDNPGIVAFPTPAANLVALQAASGPCSSAAFRASRLITVVPVTAPVPDFHARSLTVPASLAVTHPTPLTYVVENTGDAAVAGRRWTDAVYLSRDRWLDSDDRLMATATVSPGLPKAGFYTNTVEVSIPLVPEGLWHLILSVDDNWEVLERHQLNNELAVPTDLLIPRLNVGGMFKGQFTGSAQAQYLLVMVTNSGPLRITLNNATADHRVELYAAHGSPPTRGTFDDSAATGPGASRDLLIPSVPAGALYVLAYGDHIPAPGAFTVQVTSAAVYLTGITPNRHANTVGFDLTLTGAGFESGTVVELLAGNGALAGTVTKVSVDSFTQMTATFPPNFAAPGLYSVRLRQPDGDAASLADAFEAHASPPGAGSSSTPAADFETDLILPGRIGYHAVATIYVQCRNRSPFAIPAPLLLLTATQEGREGAFLTMDSFRVKKGFWTSAKPESFQGFFSRIQFLASGNTPGVLQPGESASVPVYYAGWQIPWDFAYPPITFTVHSTTVQDTNRINWLDFKASMRPITLNEEQWEPVFANLVSQVGTTWGDYVRTLANNASYLGRLGSRVLDVDELLMLALQRANGLPVPTSLADSTDVAVRAPGLSLTFGRTFPTTVSGRLRVGPLGRGWFHNWEYSLEVGSDGTVGITSPGGALRTFQPDSRYTGYLSLYGDQATLTALAGNAFALQETSGLVRAFRSDGNLDYVQDPNGNRITASYSGALLTTLTHSSGQRLDLAYDGPSRVASVTGYAGPDNPLYTNRFRYAAGYEHLAAVDYYDSRSTSYGYDVTPGSPSQHALTRITTTCCLNQYLTYDRYGRLESTARDGGAELVTFSNEFAGKLTITDALGASSQMYLDQWGSTVKTINPLGHASQTSYDSASRPVAYTDATGRQSRINYDARGNISQTIDPLGSATLFTSRGPFAGLQSLRDARGNTTRFQWTPTGDLSTVTYPDLSLAAYTYDAAGNVTSITNRRGHVINLQYDAAGVLTNKLFPDGSKAIYQFDRRGILTNAALIDSNATVTEFTRFRYDENDRLIKVIYPDDLWVEFTYDTFGRRASSQDQLGHSLAYYYNAAGRLQSVTNELGRPLVIYEYDRAGRLTTKTLGNGLATTYSYDPASRLQCQTNRFMNKTPVSWLNYTYDNAGRRTSMTTQYGRWTYGYDDLGQLTHAVLNSTDLRIPDQELAYVYDAAGNRTLTRENGTITPYTVNSMNQYVRVGDTTCLFDRDGNLLAELTVDGARVTTNSLYVYDTENRLTRVDRGAHTWAFGYDALGNRTTVTEDEVVRRFVLDPTDLGSVVGVYTSGHLSARYVQCNGLISRVTDSGEMLFYSTGDMGNVAQVIGSDGMLQAEYVYAPFGRKILDVHAWPDLFQFGGEFGVMDDGTGLSFMRARFYHPDFGRFCVMDPIGYSSRDINLYRYVYNAPTGGVDPSGKKPKGDFAPDWLLPKWADPLLGLAHRRCNMTIRVSKNDVRYNAYRVHEMVHCLDFLSGHYENEADVEVSEARAYHAMVAQGIADGVPKKYLDYWRELEGLARNGLYRKQGPSVEAKHNLDHSTTAGDSGASESTGAADPNSKSGARGFGTAGFVPVTLALSYRIDFENDPSATAPAQQVIITDQLAATLEWSTFEVSEVGFGGELIAIPPGRQHFETNVPCSYLGTNFTVQVEVGVRLDTGQVYATLRSVDLESELPPPVDIGFLPPEDGTGRGQGHIAYFIKPKAGLPTGTEIRNVALISFDNQPPIATNQKDPHNAAAGTDPAKECLNTIDAGAPSSSVYTLPALSGRTIPVRWAGQDDAGGSGVVSYDVYVSADGTNYTRWLHDTHRSEGVFTGEVGASYRFFSVARDGVRNEEAAPLVPDAFTTVSVDSPALDPITAQVAAVGGEFILTITASSSPGHPLSFALGPGAPAGATVNPTNGVFRWTPSCAQAARTHQVTVWATDSMQTHLQDALTFHVTVGECTVPGSGRVVALAGDPGRVPVKLVSSVPLAKLQMTLDGSQGRLTDLRLEPVAPVVCGASIEPMEHGQHRLELSACPGIALMGTQQVAWLYFRALSEQASAFVSLRLEDTVGWHPDGAEVRDFGAQAGQVVVVGGQPLLEALVATDGQPRLILYSKPGAAVTVETTPTLMDAAAWQPEWQGKVEDLFLGLVPSRTSDHAMFFRALRK